MLTLLLLKYAAFVVPSVVLGAFLTICVYLYRLHSRYDHLPGPKRTSFFFGNASDFASAAKKGTPLVYRMLEMQEEYGPVYVIFMFHRAYISIADPTTVKEILMSDVHVKSDDYDRMYDLYGARFMGHGLATEQDHSKWYNHRKIFNPAFYRWECHFTTNPNRSLMGLMGYFNDSSDKLVIKLKENADTGKAVPLMDGFGRTTIDVIAKAGFGMTQELILEENPFVDAVEMAYKGLFRKIRKPYDVHHVTYYRQYIVTALLVRDEVDAIVGDKDFIEYEDVMKMEYTLLVLKETLRMYRPALGTIRKTAHEISVCGHKIPTGSNVQLNNNIMANMERFFKNPMTFDPERFLRDEDKPLYTYIPFSLGPRSCIGQQFALIEARVILAKLYQNYDFKLDPTQSFGITEQGSLKPKGHCMNYIYCRQ